MVGISRSIRFFLCSQWNYIQWPESFNNVFGRTLNPFNRSLTCGGSSGGEGALVGIKGSPLGVGSDIGGYVPLLPSRQYQFIILKINFHEKSDPFAFPPRSKVYTA